MPTKIQAQDVDTTTEFILSELSLSDGTVSLPSLSFSSDQDTGIFRNAANNMRLVSNGIAQLEIDSSGVYTRGAQHFLEDGTSGAPSLTFRNDPDTGFYGLGGNRIGVSIGGAQQWAFTAAGDLGATSTGKVLAGDGTATSPGYQFNADANTGMYRSGSDILSFALAGAQRLELNGTALTWKNAGSHAYMYIDRFDTSTEGLLIFITGGVGTNQAAVGLDNDGTNNLNFFTGGNLGVPKLTLNTSGNLLAIDGTAGAPAYSFVSDPDTGIFRPTADTIAFATIGAERFRLTGGTFRGVSGLVMEMGDGSSSSPAYSFVNESNTGMYRAASNDLRLVVAGIRQLELTATANIMRNNPLYLSDGSVSAPGYTFNADPDTGIYRPTANTFAIATGGTEKVVITSGGGIRPQTYSTSFYDGGFGECVKQNQSTTIDYGLGGDFTGFIAVKCYNNVNTAHGTKLFWVAASATDMSFTQIAASGTLSGSITVTNPSGTTFRVQLGAVGSSNNSIQFIRTSETAG